jgi:hypothetical protein
MAVSTALKKNPPVFDVDRQLIQQQQVVDGGLVGLHVCSKYEAVSGEMAANLSDGILRATVTLEVSAALRNK